METGTFPMEGFQDYVYANFVPVKYISGPDADQFARFDVNIEPTFMVLDHDGNEVYRKIGFFEADLLISQLEKARKKAAHRMAKKG